MNQATGAEASSTSPIGVLGGTFDPVHLGHLRTALEVLEHCRLSGVRLIPCAVPPHRPAAVASTGLRLRMLQAAVAGDSRFAVDERELRRPGPSYTVDTLLSLRAELGPVSLCLIVGADAFLGLPAWHRWREIVALCHIVVVHRPGWELTGGAEEVAGLLRERRSDDPEALRSSPAGAIRVQPVTALDISSSAIRVLVAGGGDPKFLVPDAVRDLISSSGCYAQPQASREAQRRA